MNRFLCLFAATAASLAAQTTTVFPADYRDVAEGPNNSPNLPFANGAGRTMLFYDHRDLALPAGASIHRLGFRQDMTLTSLDQGRSLQLEIRMGYTETNPTSPNTTFDANWSSPPVTVFGPSLLTLPNLRDPNQPLPNGQFFVDLATPFVHQHNGKHLVVEYRVLGNSAGGASFNYRLDRADFFSPVRTGPAGCRHSGGQVPTLSVTPTRTGGTVTATIAQAPANSFLMLGIQLGELATPYDLGTLIPGIDPTCKGQIALGSLAAKPGASNSSGGATLTYTIPNDLAFRGLYLSHQAACFDFFAPGGMVVGNGAELRVGQRPMTSSLTAQGPVTVATGTVNAHYCPVAFFVWQ